MVGVANTSVGTDPTGSLTMDRNGGNGISATNPLLVHFQAIGTANASHALTQYMLNFGDGTSLNMPVSGTGTFDLFVDHQYTVNGRFTPTLTLVGNDTAAAVVTDTSFPTLSISSTPPMVTTTFSTSTNILSAVFSEDVGAALVGGVDSNDNPTGEPEWTDGTVTAGKFANALDVRNDNSGGNLTLTSAPYSYNASNFTATWNLTGLVSTGSTSYTARLFAADIQDQAGNDLDGVGSGFGGDDSTPIHFGTTYPTTNVTLSTSGTWNASMPLVFAPSIAPNSIQSITTVNASGTPSTQITFTANAANEAILDAIGNGDPVIISDITASGLRSSMAFGTSIRQRPAGAATLTIPYGTLLTGWVAGSAGTLHVSNPGEVELITALKQITGAGSIPMTSLVTNGIDVGITSTFDTSTLTDPTGYNLSFDNETQLGSDGYIVRSVSGPHLEIVGGGPGGENDAVDAFLQSLGMQMYGPQNVYNGTYANVWQVTPSDSTLSGSWDIRSYPSVGYLDNSGGSGGWGYSENAGWTPFYLFNYGGGTPVPAVAQPGNLGVGSNAANIEDHTDYWSQVTSTGTMSSLAFAATAMPWARSTSATPSRSPSPTFRWFPRPSRSRPIPAITRLRASPPHSITTFTPTSPIRSSRPPASRSRPTANSNTNNAAHAYLQQSGRGVLSYDYRPEPTRITTKKNGVSGDPNFLPSVTKDYELNFTNGSLINSVITNDVAPPWVSSNPSPGPMLSLEPQGRARVTTAAWPPSP